MRMRPRAGRRAVAGLAAAAALGGCTTQDRSTVPVACKSGPEAVGDALVAAPEAVRLDGTPLSACLAPSSDPADVQAVGVAYVEAASRLVPRAESEPEGPEAAQLGYLMGATRRGAERTQGIHDELVRRLEQELGPVDTDAAAFEDGERAGLASG